MTRARDLGDFITDGGVSQLDVTGNVTINGTCSTEGNVSIADKIVHTGDTNTAIRFPAADTVTVETDGAEKFRVTATELQLGSDLNLNSNDITGSGNINTGGGITATGTGSFNNGSFSGNVTVNGTFSIESDVNIADKIVHTGDTNTAIRFPAADTVSFETAGSERLRVASAGQLGIGGANYGTAGQVLTSGGSSSAVTWAAPAAAGALFNNFLFS